MDRAKDSFWHIFWEIGDNLKNVLRLSHLYPPLQFLGSGKDDHLMSIQGPLITDGRNSRKWTGPTVGLSKSFIRVKISGQNF